MPNRGMLVLSKLCAVAVQVIVMFAIYLIVSPLSCSILFGERLVFDFSEEFVKVFALHLLLHYAFSVLVTAVTILLRGSALSMTFGIIVSAGGEDTYVTSGENKVVAVNLAIEEQDDKIMKTYSIGDKSYSTEVTTEDVTIYVKSSDRVDSDDKNGVKLNIENTTDLNVFIKVADDDATSPRFTVGRKLGTVVVY